MKAVLQSLGLGSLGALGVLLALHILWRTGISGGVLLGEATAVWAAGSSAQPEHSCWDTLVMLGSPLHLSLLQAPFVLLTVCHQGENGLTIFS